MHENFRDGRHVELPPLPRASTGTAVEPVEPVEPVERVEPVEPAGRFSSVGGFSWHDSFD